MQKIKLPDNYDYVGIYLTDKCFLNCEYCITTHHGAQFGHYQYDFLKAEEWIKGLNRLVLPEDVPISFQGGEPFLYNGIWEILNQIEHKVDIMTALPPFLKKDHFLALKSLDWNKRKAAYPTIRVSYHKGQNNFEELIERVKDLQDIISIGVYYLEHPSYDAEGIRYMKAFAKKKGVEFRSKEFLGKNKGETHGTFKYPESVQGRPAGIKVGCINSVMPVAPDGSIFLCHSDLYFNRKRRILGNILDESFRFPQKHILCNNFGLCNECDVKIKTNRYQQYGYTSVDIRFEDERTAV